MAKPTSEMPRKPDAAPRSTIGLRGLAATTLPFLIAACASGGPGGAAPTPSRAPLPAEEMVMAGEGSPPAGDLVSAVAAGSRDLAYVLALSTLERCGTGPLGQQALLMLAAAELDPRNPDPHLSLAHASLELVLGAADEGSWSKVVAESFYLVAQRLGARPAPPPAADESELRWRARQGDEARAASGRVSPGACDPLPWPAGSGPEAWSGDAEPPRLEEASYPVRITRLQRRVAELEEEIERLRRIARRP